MSHFLVRALNYGVFLVMRTLRGLLYCYLLFGNMIVDYYLLACPCVPLAVLHPRLSRRLSEIIASYWEIYVCTLVEMFGIKVVVSGDHFQPDETAILLMNHPTGNDWNFFFSAAYQAGMPHVARENYKYVLKHLLQHVPGFGWNNQLNGNIFISQSWEKDRKWISQCLDRIVSSGINFKLLMFPEGAALIPRTKESSDKYAKSCGLPEYEYVLHPRTTGFSYLSTHLREANHLDAIYDMTIAYPDLRPKSIVDYFLGKFPKEVHVNIKKILETDTPKDKEALKSWLRERWRHKEITLKDFYVKKSFSDEPWGPYDRSIFYINFCIWTSLTIMGTILIIYSPAFRIWVLLWSILTFCLSTFWSITLIEIKWYQFWKSIFESEEKINK